MDPNNLQEPTPPPQQPTPPTGQFDSSQFDFIMNPQQPAKKGLLPPMSPKQRKLAFVGIGAVIILVIIMLISMLLGGSSGPVEQVVTVAQKQNEIIRIADIGNQKAGSSETQTLAAFTSSVITSDQKKTIDYLAQQKRKLKNKELAQLQDGKIDTDLNAAETNGRFDEVFTKTLLEKLAQYRDLLKSTQPSLGANGKELLEQNYNNVVIIIKDNQFTSEVN